MMHIITYSTFFRNFGHFRAYFWPFLVENAIFAIFGRKCHFQPFFVENAIFGHFWSKMPFLVENAIWSKMPFLAIFGRKCQFWPFLVENAIFGHFWSKMPFLAIFGRKCHFWPRVEYYDVTNVQTNRKCDVQSQVNLQNIYTHILINNNFLNYFIIDRLIKICIINVTFDPNLTQHMKFLTFFITCDLCEYNVIYMALNTSLFHSMQTCYDF